ncbi:MAG: MotA/TolQ/ExbB proton channel family protein [Oscillospiraceae bacterium]|jgi:chemotaxis protein MotA|nr:MotA/TolQ/ExbB proton channel family protein [Oscillospiraceae bacterium]
MNISFVIGLAVAFGLVVWGILDSGDLMSFWDMASVIITIGGTLATLFASFPLRDFLKMFQHFPILLGLGKQKWDPIYYIDTMTDLSQEARKKGLLALEDRVAEFEDPFLRDSVMLIVDAMEPDKVRDQLDNEIGNIEARHSTCWNLYDKGAALAPGFGMIGTLIGLINMLAGMDFEEEGGAQTLAANMAIALITTFYGSMLANVVFMPIANQLRIAHNEEMLCKEIIIEGIISIQAGENPRHINEKLMGYLTRRQREQHAAKQGVE